MFTLHSFLPKALFVCKVVARSLKGGWRSIWAERGAQSAATDGGMKTLLWPADSWAKGEQVHTLRHRSSHCPDFAALQQHTWTQVWLPSAIFNSMKCPSEIRPEIGWNFCGIFRVLLMLHALFFCAFGAFQTPISERYFNTRRALVPWLPGLLCPPVSCNCVSFLMFSCQRSNGCARSHTSTYAQFGDICGQWNQKWGARWHVHMHVHRGVSESPHGNGRGEADHRALFIWYVSETRLTWLLNVILQNVQSRTGSSSVCSLEHQNTLESCSLQRRWVRSAPVSKNHLEWRGVCSGRSRHVYTAARLSLPPWHGFYEHEIWF